MIPAGKRENKGFAVRLLNRIGRFLAAFCDYWKRRTRPPGSEQGRTYTDQW